MTTREAGKAGEHVATATLIEAVREPERFMASTSVNGTRYARQCVNASNYDALRAATLAVLEGLEAACDHGQPRETFEIAMANARALREKLR